MVRYSVLRLMLFFGFLCLFWLLSLRGLWLLLAAALASMVVSFWLLRRLRQDFSAQLARRLDARASRAEQRAAARAATRDEAVEDGAALDDGTDGARKSAGDAFG